MNKSEEWMKITRIPLFVEARLWSKLTNEELRWLRRIEGVGVRPLVRGYGHIYGLHRERLVGANIKPDFSLGVAYVGHEEAVTKRVQVKKASDDQGMLISGFTPEQFRQIVGDAQASLQELSQTIVPEKLVALARLAQAFEKLNNLLVFPN